MHFTEKCASFPDAMTLKWLIVGLIMVSVPHITHISLLTPLFVGFLLTWRYFGTTRQWQIPVSSIRFLLTLFALVYVIMSHGTLRTQSTWVDFLICLSALKFLEMHGRRDALLVCFLGYFLIIAHFLYSQSIATALYMLLVTLVITGNLIRLSDHQLSLSAVQRLRLANTLLWQAIPLMLVLFILFPRLGSPLWGIPKSENAVTGLSDSMSLGHISELSLSDEIAFWVRFTDEVPTPTQLYWRGPVLWSTDGINWTNPFPQIAAQDVPLIPLGDPVRYTVTLEPHNEAWLLALDIPNAPPRASLRSFQMLDYQVLSFNPIHQRVRYEIESYLDYAASSISRSQYRSALRLPRGRHAQTRALATQWREELQDPALIIQRALQHFQEEEFYYTYTPPFMHDDVIDQFMFEGRSGFCEHYAAAFAVLMRAAGIPTRVVTGYQGGSINPIDGYMIVRQRDAHAWNEVWLDGRGWVRVDPTAAVSPERVQVGIDQTLPQQSPLGMDNNSALMAFWRQMQNTVYAVNNGWNQWVLGYDPQRQQQLLSWLGLEKADWGDMTLALVAVISVILVVLGLWMFVYGRRTRQQDPIQLWYERFCRKLARQGWIRQPSEGALTFATRVSQARPEWQGQVQLITQLYMQARYRDKVELLQDLRGAVQRFRPK